MSGDLISKSRLMEDIRNTITENSSTLDWLNLISRQPTAYDVDNVVEKLEKAIERESLFRGGMFKDGAMYAFRAAIRIIKAGGRDEFQ